MTITGLDVIARSPSFESAGNHVDLRPWQWHLLHALDGRMELRDVAITCGIDLNEALSLVDDAHEAGLVSVLSLSLDDYRRWSGREVEAVDGRTDDRALGRLPTSDDHFSTTDVLAAYERPVPAWMIEPEPVAPSESAPAEEPAHHPYADHAAAYDAEPSADQHAEAVAETPAETAAWDRAETAVAEHAETPAWDHQTHAWDHAETPAYDHVETPAYDHVETPAYDHVETPAYDHVETPHYDHVDAPAYDHAESPAWDHADAVAETPLADALDEASAAKAVADLVAGHQEPAYEPEEPYAAATAEPAAASNGYADAYVEEPVAEAPAEPAAPSERASISYSFGGDDHAPASSNGHAMVWEPLSLVTSVEDDHQRLESDSFHDASMPAGVSISLSSGATDVVHEPERQERGSVSFTLSSDDLPASHAAPVYSHDVRPEPVAAEAAPPAPHYDAEPQSAHYEFVPAATSAQPEAAAEPAPVHEPENLPAGVYAAAKPSNGYAGSAPAAAEPPAQPAAPASSSTTADIVGSLISRALTFRIK